MATNPTFTATPVSSQARITAANTARDGSGTLVTAYTVPAGGARLDRLVFTSAQATAAASTAMIVRMFVTDASGSNPRLRAEKALPTATASDTAPGATVNMDFTAGLVLLEGQIVKVCQSIYAGVQDQVDVFVEGGEFA